jgi:hypothetical protein
MNVPFDAEAPDKNARHRPGNTTTRNAMKRGSRRKPPRTENGRQRQKRRRLVMAAHGRDMPFMLTECCVFRQMAAFEQNDQVLPTHRRHSGCWKADIVT